MDGAGTDDDEDTALGVGVLDAGYDFVAGFEDGVFGLLGLSVMSHGVREEGKEAYLENFMLKKVGGCEWIDASY